MYKLCHPILVYCTTPRWTQLTIIIIINSTKIHLNFLFIEDGVLFTHTEHQVIMRGREDLKNEIKWILSVTPVLFNTLAKMANVSNKLKHNVRPPILPQLSGSMYLKGKSVKPLLSGYLLSSHPLSSGQSSEFWKISQSWPQLNNQLYYSKWPRPPSCRPGEWLSVVLYL